MRNAPKYPRPGPLPRGEGTQNCTSNPLSLWERARVRVLSLLPFCAAFFIAAILFMPAETFAQSFTLNLGGAEDAGGGSVASRVVQIVALLTVLSLAPSILMMMTSFTRIVVVLSFLRTAMGAQQTPPNTVLISLAMFLTLFIMMPTINASYEEGLKPLMNDEVTEMEGMERASAPFKRFMLKHTREKDLALFIKLSKIEPPKEALDTPMQVVIPSFMISELRRAFEIGFLIFLPFLVIDMVTASILMSMGMMMLPPIMIALPFKIIFFVLVDGWWLITGSLVQSYGA